MTSAEFSLEPGMDIIPAYESDPVQFFSGHNKTAVSEDLNLYSDPAWLDHGNTINEPFADDIDVEGSISTDNQGNSLHRVIGKVVVPATFLAVGLQQSPLNETFRANRTFEVLAETGSPWLAGLATLGWTIPIEGVTGAVISAGLLSQRDKIQPFLEKRIRKNSDDEQLHHDDLAEQLHVNDDALEVKDIKLSKKASSFLVDAGITCSIGPGMVVAKRHVESADRTFKKDMETLFSFTALGAAVSGAIGYLATGGVEHADKVGMKAPAEWFAENAADWKFWTVVLGTGYAVKTIHSKTKKLFTKRKKTKNVDNLQQI